MCKGRATLRSKHEWIKFDIGPCQICGAKVILYIYRQDGDKMKQHMHIDVDGQVQRTFGIGSLRVTMLNLAHLDKLK